MALKLQTSVFHCQYIYKAVIYIRQPCQNLRLNNTSAKVTASRYSKKILFKWQNETASPWPNLQMFSQFKVFFLKSRKICCQNAHNRGSFQYGRFVMKCVRNIFEIKNMRSIFLPSTYLFIHDNLHLDSDMQVTFIIELTLNYSSTNIHLTISSI